MGCWIIDGRAGRIEGDVWRLKVEDGVRIVARMLLDCRKSGWQVLEKLRASEPMSIASALVFPQESSFVASRKRRKPQEC